MQTTTNSDQLIWSELWSSQLKDILRDELFAYGFVQDLGSEFSHGTTFTIPSVGDAQTDNYEEGQDVVYRQLATGEFQFTITEYLSSGLAITEKLLQDSYYADRVMAEFVPKESRAIMEHFERTTLSRPEEILGATTNGQYIIDGARHRFVGGGTGGRIELADFAYAWYALDKANVPVNNRIAIVPPEVSYTLSTLSNLVDVSDNPRWEGVITQGLKTGTRFIRNVYGFDVYVSNYLPDVTDGALPDRDGGNAVDFSSTAGKACYFFSADSTVLPLVSQWRQAPKVDYQFNQNKQQHEHLTTARYGVKLYRPENMVSVPVLASV